MKKISLLLILSLIMCLFASCDFRPNLSQQLISAIKNDDFDTFEKLLAQNPNLDANPYIFNLDRVNMPPLHVACFEGKIEFVRRLIEAGADVNSIDRSLKTTPLMVALTYAYKNGYEIAEFLIESGADVNIVARSETALNKVFVMGLADEREAYDFAMFLIERGARIDVGGYGNVIFSAVSGNNLLMIEYLLKERNVDINFQNNNQGYTPLIFAVLCNKPEVVEYLINNGADISKTDANGRTALDIAKENNYTEIIELLNNYGYPQT